MPLCRALMRAGAGLLLLLVLACRAADLGEHCKRGTSATEFWLEHREELYKASLYPPLSTYVNHKTDEYNNIFSALAPEILDRGVRWLGQREKVRKLMEKAERGEPIKIFVTGGSVTWGNGCRQQRHYSMHHCTWSLRVEQLINTFAGHNNTVIVHNGALRGTSTDTGTQLVKYKQWPEEFQDGGPDVIINAHSTNDMGWLVESEQQLRVELETFVRTTLEPCDSPVLVILEEYMGNENHVVSEEIILGRTLQELAIHYDFTYVSWPAVARQHVLSYADQGVYSPKWYDGQPYHRQVHPDWIVHQGIAYLLAYSAARAFTGACGMSLWDATQGTNGGAYNVTSKHELGMFPPPLYDSRTRLDSFEWAPCGTKRFGEPQSCAVAWIAAILEQDIYGPKLQGIRDATEHLVVASDGFTIASTYGKSGWIAMQGGAHMTWRISSGISGVIEINHMQSYGEDWGTSRVTVTKADTDEVLEESIVDNVNKRNVSTSHTSKFLVPPSTAIDIRIEVITGRTMKILGMFAC